ncbi:MAG: hypothetical protein ACOC05_11260, partial [Oceanicaulis sp.]
MTADRGDEATPRQAGAPHPDASRFGAFFAGAQVVTPQPQDSPEKDSFWPRVLALYENRKRLLRRRATLDGASVPVAQMAYAGTARFDVSTKCRDLGFVVDTPFFEAAWVRVHVAVSDCEAEDNRSRLGTGSDPRLRNVRAEASGKQIGVAFARGPADNLGALTVSYFIMAAGKVTLPANAALADKPVQRDDGVFGALRATGYRLG